MIKRSAVNILLLVFSESHVTAKKGGITACAGLMLEERISANMPQNYSWVML